MLRRGEKKQLKPRNENLFQPFSVNLLDHVSYSFRISVTITTEFLFQIKEAIP